MTKLILGDITIEFTGSITLNSNGNVSEYHSKSLPEGVTKYGSVAQQLRDCSDLKKGMSSVVHSHTIDTVRSTINKIHGPGVFSANKTGNPHEFLITKR